MMELRELREVGQVSSAAQSLQWRIPVADNHTSAALDAAPSGGERPVFVCAHGAGGNMSDRGTLQTAAELVRRGLSVVRFNFLYKELRSARPDPMPLLKACLAAVVARVRQELAPTSLIIGGRSMGGRAASMLAAEGFECSGLLLLAYPLHPTGRPDQLRDAHLPGIRVPVLCFNGTRDTMCRRDLMERALERVTTRWQMHWLDGADHGFHVLKRSGKTDAAVLSEIAAAAALWVETVVPAASAE
ncbi:MAG: alpha/beta hydrolase family protein [Gemmatimonadaceae bacterium]